MELPYTYDFNGIGYVELTALVAIDGKEFYCEGLEMADGSEFPAALNEQEMIKVIDKDLNEEREGNRYRDKCLDYFGDDYGFAAPFREMASDIAAYHARVL